MIEPELQQSSAVTLPSLSSQAFSNSRQHLGNEATFAFLSLTSLKARFFRDCLNSEQGDPIASQQSSYLTLDRFISRSSPCMKDSRRATRNAAIVHLRDSCSIAANEHPHIKCTALEMRTENRRAREHRRDEAVSFWRTTMTAD